MRANGFMESSNISCEQLRTSDPFLCLTVLTVSFRRDVNAIWIRFSDS